MGAKGVGEALPADCGATVMLTSKYLEELEEYARKHTVNPGVVETQEEADRFTEVDRILGIHHKWNVGDKYYTLLCHLTPEEVE